MIDLVLLAITDSGLGGLSICAALERDLRGSRLAGHVAMAYVNAWPEESHGYNDLPDTSSRAAVFDRALARMAAMGADHLLIACNTLSILYPATRFSRSAPFPVKGIVDAGVTLFTGALRAAPDASIVLLGTRTTVASGTHRDRLVESGIAPERIAGVSCHGLATAIERDIDGPGVGELIAACAREVRGVRPPGERVFVGLCCTHYGYVAPRIGAELARALGREVVTLDPNMQMVQDVMADLGLALVPDRAAEERPTVEVVSKVTLDERTRTGIAGLVRAVSPATADALVSYRHVPALF
jgi:glutamate racemase